MSDVCDLDQLRSVLRPGFSLQEALETLLADDTSQNTPNEIYVEPPQVSILTDEESGDEDEGAVERKSGLFFLRWLDSGIVTVSSTAHGIQPLKPVKRYSKEQRKNVIIPRPSIISNYNKYMGGTDQMDWNVYKYRTSIRGKKWTWNIITWMLDVVINNAWLMYRHHNKKTAQLDFRRTVAQYYLTAYGTPSLRPGPSGAPLALTTRVTKDVRFDDKGHYVVNTDAGKRRRCAFEDCDSKVRTMCRKCNVGLCVPHFYVFHLN
ncbi:hypothetical protein GE061_019305 [Apolygus lucorum]|uniref:PiggyBac transposable element-derived protein domain-containing protein n=1 Tax=Apolygus lucorum TaxID=248454 RepID=A0A8S9XA15_APOLU|nr:hypothetical protein GE061_019305 [Apolygus lucorum]